jgi:hypothetical protein
MSLVDVTGVALEDATLGVHGSEVLATLDSTLLDTTGLVLGSTVA